MNKETIPALITQNDLAAQLGVTRQTLLAWRTSRKGPPHVRIGGRIRYRVEDVKAWIEQNVTAA